MYIYLSCFKHLIGVNCMRVVKLVYEHLFHQKRLAQPAGAVEYTECFSAEK